MVQVIRTASRHHHGHIAATGAEIPLLVTLSDSLKLEAALEVGISEGPAERKEASDAPRAALVPHQRHRLVGVFALNASHLSCAAKQQRDTNFIGAPKKQAGFAVAAASRGQQPRD